MTTDLQYRLIIFDFDGTLADSGDWFVSMIDHLAQCFDFRRVSPEEVEALRGRTTRDVIRLLGIPRWKLPRIARHARALLSLQTDRIALFDGVAPLLWHLRASGVRLALVTSNAEHNVRAILGGAAAAFDWFECDAALFGKARRYRRIVRRSGLACADTLSIGDETRDIVAARKAGVAAGAVLWGYAHADALLAMHPDFVFASPADIAAVAPGGGGGAHIA